jgi:radical SAM superfamily enzyme YgiQ (UPF0313 family)
MGLESPRSHYTKLQGTDTRQLTRELREHGIRVQGSTIIGLEHHTPENLVEEIDYAVDHRADFHQFMLYTPVPGTPLHQEMSKQGRMLANVNFADIHGQDKFNFQHAAISREDSKRFLDRAFRRDFEQNGPSLYRMCQTMLQGWRRYRDYPDARVRERFARESAKLRTVYNAALWAMERQFRQVNRSVSDDIRALRQEVEKEFGMASRVAARCCCGRSGVKNGDWLLDPLTNRPRFSSAVTGRRRRLTETHGMCSLAAVAIPTLQHRVL